jgi:pimeloyl-ACP methyl ester carboxylesterase
MFERVDTHVASTHGVQLAVYTHEPSTTTHPNPILFSHATGFHGRVFTPVAEHLTGHSCTSFDYRGYGDTAAPTGTPLAWEHFGDDAVAMAQHVFSRHRQQPIVGVGHSMGGAALIMAALREPQLFAALIVFEPIIFPPEVRTQAGSSNPLADVTRRRRRTFTSYGEAISNFAAKPPLSSLHPDALAAYVHFGFTQTTDGVSIKCDPEFEAQTYEMGAYHDTWQALGQLRTPTWVIAGAHADRSPAAIAPLIAERIPESTFVEWRDLGHFGPLDNPVRFADFIAARADSISRQ